MKASEFEAIKSYCKANEADINFLRSGEEVEVYHNGYMVVCSNYHELTKAVLASKNFEAAGWVPA